jgi:hypothetical protein
MLSAEAIEAIRAGFAVSDQPHQDSRVWREAQEGEELDIYLDLINDADRERIERDFAALAGALGADYATSRK